MKRRVQRRGAGSCWQDLQLSLLLPPPSARSSSVTHGHKEGLGVQPAPNTIWVLGVMFGLMKGKARLKMQPGVRDMKNDNISKIFLFLPSCFDWDNQDS